MPQFQLNAARYGKHPFYALNDFAKGYVEAMFFTNGDTGDTGDTGDDHEDLLNDLGVEKLTREAVKDIAADCDKFIGTIMPDGRFCRQWLDEIGGQCDYNDNRAGHDFWFTRQGHGVGYWDRDELHEEQKDALSNLARSFGEAYPKVALGWIYHR